MLVGLALMNAAIFIPFFAPSIGVLLVGEIIFGFLGVFSLVVDLPTHPSSVQRH